MNLDFVKQVGQTDRLSYGIAFNYNKLTSNAFFENIDTDSTYTGLNRYPTNGGDMQKYSIYVNNRWFGNPQFIINTGLRYDFIKSEINLSTEKPQLAQVFEVVSYNKGAPSASVNFDIYPGFMPGFLIKFFGSMSTHIPIIDEYAKIMVKNYTIVIPNNQLKPETSYNLELGISKTFLEVLSINASVFNSWIHNAIILDNHSLQGEDSLFFGIDQYNITTNTNIQNAQVYGISGGIRFVYFLDSKETKSIKFFSSANFIKGLDLTNNSALPNISPIFGQSSLTFQYKKISLLLSHNYNGLKKREDLSIYGEDYIEKSAEVGFVAWQTFNMKLSFTLFDYASFNFAINNIFNTFYRNYSSAISAPGRNFIFTLKLFIN